MSHAIFLFLALVAFWAVLSGHFEERFLVGAGLLTAAAVTVAMVRLRLVLMDEWPLRRVLRAAVVYLPWLLWQAVVANVRMIRIVWSPRAEVAPRLVRVPCRLRTSLGRATFANSITFTPGTVSILVEEDAVLVHALTADDEAGLLDGSLERHVARLEAPA
ncbi:MAG: Na+/H+ antiporter subunit E [Planctomycetes bacterium]|nr:Na+/H+ antiporter subunit E [Planctomycetota bacterium]